MWWLMMNIINIWWIFDENNNCCIESILHISPLHNVSAIRGKTAQFDEVFETSKDIENIEKQIIQMKASLKII